ncbi:MAG: serine/threonine-protein kinase [Sandaracinus sp.]
MSDAPKNRGDDTGRIVVGKKVGAYEIESQLGKGGMAVVYVARHRDLDKRVAIKVLRSELAESDEIRKRFLREGRAAARVRHPHVVDITDVGSDGDDVYLVMELLEGETLASVIDREIILAPERVVDYLVPVVAALGAAHKNGVVHRDLKPENIFLARDPSGRAFPKVLDFGISHLRDNTEERVTELGSVLGTPQYMSPEQARGEDSLTPQTDQFSLGIILYEALVGRLPYEGETPVQLIHEVARGDVRPMRTFKSWIPQDLEEVVMRALAGDPSKRYPTIEELGLALLPFGSEHTEEVWRAALLGQTQRPSLAPPTMAGPPTTGRRRRQDLATTPHRRATGSQPRAAAASQAAVESAVPTPVPTPGTPTAAATPAGRGWRALAAIAALLLVLAMAGYLTFGRAPATSTVTLHVSPPGQVRVDGRVIGSGSDVAIAIPDDGRAHEVVLEADGYHTVTRSVRRADELGTSVALEAIPAASTALGAATGDVEGTPPPTSVVTEPPPSTTTEPPSTAAGPPPTTGRPVIRRPPRTGTPPTTTRTDPDDDLRTSR